MKPAVLLQVVGLVDRVEGDRRVEVGEDDDEEDLADDVGPAVGAEEGGEVERRRGVDELADRRREGHDRGGEDHRDDAGHVHAQRQVGRAAGGHPAPDHALGVLHRDPALALLDEDDADDHGQRDERHHHDEDLVGVGPPGLRSRSGSPAAIEAKIISEIPLPIPRWVISSPSHISSVQPAVSEITTRNTRPEGRRWRPAGWRRRRRSWTGRGRRSRRLGEREDDGEVARVLRDLLLADLALLLEALERRHDHRQQLQDDRGRDVGHDPQREQRQPREAPAREQVEEAEDVGPGEVVLQRLDRVDVDARGRDVGAEAVERQHRRREQQLAADLRDREGVERSSGAQVLSSSISSTVPPAASIFSRAVALKPCARTVSFFEISPRPRILTGWLRLARPAACSVSGVTSSPDVEALLEVGEVDRLRVGPEALERHRHLLVRAAQLAHPHVDRVLAALVAGLALRARARAVALVAAAGGLALARALAAADPLARAGASPASGARCGGRRPRGRGGPSALLRLRRGARPTRSMPVELGRVGHRRGRGRSARA